MTVRVHEKAWSNFTVKLKKAALSDRPEMARDRVLHWARQMGPAYPHERRTLYLQEVRSIFRSAGLTGVPSVSQFESAWLRSFQSWLQVRGVV